jgi:hypothetical protein
MKHKQIAAIFFISVSFSFRGPFGREVLWSAPGGHVTHSVETWKNTAGCREKALFEPHTTLREALKQPIASGTQSRASPQAQASRGALLLIAF